MTRGAEYKTLEDGSIDYGHYIRKGHAIRSQSAHQGFWTIARGVAAAMRAARQTGDANSSNAVTGQTVRGTI